MTAQPGPRQRSRALWADARFMIGVVLVAVSVIGVWFVVAAARNTVPVFSATRTITVGEVVDVGELRVIDVALGSLDGAYATGENLPEGAVATRTIHAGELVPVAAVGEAGATRTTTVVVRSGTEVPASVAVGSTVEVWASPIDENGVLQAPRILVADAAVAAVTRDDSMMGGGAASVELVIPRAEVADVLAALAAETVLSVVPADGAR